MGKHERVKLRNVGWGPFPLPGERKREERARAEAERLMTLVEEIEQRGGND